jgi:hypothetical protein
LGTEIAAVVPIGADGKLLSCEMTESTRIQTQALIRVVSRALAATILIRVHPEKICAEDFLYEFYCDSLFHSRAFHGIVVLAEAFAPMMKRLINLDLHRQSTPERRHDCYWATAALFQ